MGHKLTSVQLLAALRRLGDIQLQVGQEEYPHDPEKLLRALQAIGEGRIEIVEGGAVRVSPFPCQRLASELIPQTDGKSWGVVEDVEPTFVEGCQLDFPSFLHARESLVKGKDAVPGLVDAKFVLEHQHLIPEEMRGKYLMFPGTVLLDPKGVRFVPYLVWINCWVLDFRWLDDDFDDYDRLVRKQTSDTR